MTDLLKALEPRFKLEVTLVEATPEEVLRQAAGGHYQSASWGSDDDPEDVIERLRLLRGAAAQPGVEFGDAWHQELMKYWKASEPNSWMWSEKYDGEDRFLPLAGGRRVSRVASAPNFTFIEGPYGIRLHENVADHLSLWLDRPVYLFGSETAKRTPPNPQFNETGPPHPMDNHYFMRRDPVRGHRILQAHMDYNGRFKLFQYGDPISIENPDYYKRRRILDRFNREIMLEYLANLGVDPWDLLVDHNVLDPVLTTCVPEGELVFPVEADVERAAKLDQVLEALEPRPYTAPADPNSEP